MAYLPKDTISEEPPFSYCGIDMFGPFIVKDGRKERKRCGALFTCLSLRAVHIEVAHNMTTDSFIMYLRRLIGRRGYVRMIRTDGESNFVRASAELIESFQEMNYVKIGEILQENGSEWIWWKRNPPLASNMVCFWECQITAARNFLNSLLKAHGPSLTDESLQTFLTEVEAIVNSCPLTIDDISDVASVAVPLKTTNLLIMKSRIVMPPPGIIGLIKDDMERKSWPMAKVFAPYKEDEGTVRSVRPLMGTVNRARQKSRYLEGSINNWVALVETKYEIHGSIPCREAGT